MAENKKGFILYADQKSLFDKLPDEIAGKLIKHIYSYVNDENPKVDDILLEVAFEPIKTQLKRDLVKYNNICELNKINGSKGGRPKKPTGLLGNPKKPKKPDKDKDKDKDIIKKDFTLFWDSFHSITKKHKTDKDPALKKWEKLNNKDRKKAIDNIKPYFDSLTDKKYCKKARTYLSDKNFNDEFEIKTSVEELPDFMNGDYRKMIKND